MPEITDKKQNPNLFKKGQSGNPNGRPVGSVSIVEGIKRKLLEIEPENKKTYLELFLSKLFRKAIRDGDVSLIRDMINRVDGMPKQSVDMSTLGEKINNVIYLPEKELNAKRLDTASGTTDGSTEKE